MKSSRRELLTGLGASGVATLLGSSAVAQSKPWYDAATTPLGLKLTEAQQEAGWHFLAKHQTVDIHCHPGRFFLRGVTDPSPRIAAYGAPFEDKVIGDMRSGRVDAALFAGVSDMQLLEFAPNRGLFAAREFRPGEAWADYNRQVGVLKDLVARKSVLPGRSPGDIGHAHRRHETACIFSVEGGDFIEDRLERVHQAYEDGVRAITIVHYHVNQIGDIQTAPAHHDRLTPTGAAIVREMNRAGIIVDLAHAPLSVVQGAVDTSTRPMMISHTNLSTPSFSHPRLVSLDMARMVTRSGGIVGSVPSGIGQSDFAGWIDAIFRLVDGVGVDHVAIGTDMDANYMPVFTTYRLWYLLPSALLARGMTQDEVAKVLGGNFIKLFKKVGN